MEGDIYHMGDCGENHLFDPLQDFNLELQHVLLGDYSFAGDEFCFSSDAEELQLKSALFDEDEGFNEDYDEGLQHTVTNGRSSPQEEDSSRCSRDAGVELFDTINPTAITTMATTEVTSFLQDGSREQDQCLPDNHIDNCYGDSIWTNELPMQLISSRDHMMSSPHKIHESQQISRDPSPSLPLRDHMMSSPSLASMHSQDIYYNEQSMLRNERNKLPSHEELVSMPFYKFKRLLDNPSLSADDKTKVKAIRKKGKNKSAAKHCRQRKMAMLEGLELEVATLQQQRASLARQKAQLMAETKLWEAKCAGVQ